MRTIQYDGSIRIDSRIDTQGVNKGINNIQGSVSKLSGSLGKLGVAVAAAFSVAAIIKFGSACLKVASDLQEVQNVVDVSFGDMSHAMEEFAKTSIKSFGMSELTAKKTASTFMAMSSGMGITGKTASDMSLHLTGLTGDMASFYNVSQDVANTALKSIWTGETESLKQFGVVMTDFNLQQFAYTQGIDKSTKAMTEQEKVMLRYKFVTEKLGLAQGDFARTSDSWANQTRVLTQQWEQLKGILGNGLIQALTPAIQVLNTLMSNLISFTTAFSNAIANVFGGEIEDEKTKAIEMQTLAQDNYTEAVKETVKAKKELYGFDEINTIQDDKDNNINAPSTKDTNILLANIGSMAESIGNGMTTSIKKIMSCLAPFMATLKDYGEIIYVNLIEPFGKWTISEAIPTVLNTIGKCLHAIAVAAEALKPAFEYLIKNVFSPIAEFLGKIFIEACEEFGKSADKVSDYFTENADEINKAIESIGNFISDLFTLISPILTNVWNLIKKIYDRLVDFLIISFDNALKTLSGICDFITGVFSGDWEKAWNGLVTAFNGITSSMTNQFDLVFGSIYDTACEVWENIKYVFGLVGQWFYDNLIKPVVDFFVGMWNAICNIFTSLANWFNDNVIQPVVRIFAPIVKKIGEIFAKLWEIITTLFMAAWKWFDDTVIQPIVNVFRPIVESVGGIFKSIWDKICEIFGNIGRWFSDRFNEAVDGIKNVFGSIGGFFSGIWEGIKNMFTNIGTTIGNAIGDAFKTVVNSIIGFAENTINMFIKAINGAIDLINNIPGVNIEVLEELKIPRLARGAVIPPNNEFLAVLGDQRNGVNIETPLSTMVDAFRIAMQDFKGSGSGNITLNVKSDDGFVRNLKFELDRESQRQGYKAVMV